MENYLKRTWQVGTYPQVRQRLYDLQCDVVDVIAGKVQSAQLFERLEQLQRQWTHVGYGQGRYVRDDLYAGKENEHKCMNSVLSDDVTLLQHTGKCNQVQFQKTLIRTNEVTFWTLENPTVHSVVSKIYSAYITWKVGFTSIRSSCRLPLMLNVRKLAATGSRHSGSMRDNLLYDTSRYVRFDKFSKAFSEILANRLQERSAKRETYFVGDGCGA